MNEGAGGRERFGLQAKYVRAKSIYPLNSRNRVLVALAVLVVVARKHGDKIFDKKGDSIFGGGSVSSP